MLTSIRLKGVNVSYLCAKGMHKSYLKSNLVTFYLIGFGTKLPSSMSSARYQNALLHVNLNQLFENSIMVDSKSAIFSHFQS